MRPLVFLVPCVAVGLVGCATGSRRVSPIAYSKPDISVITRPVSAARASNTRASGSVAEAVVRIQRATIAAQAIVDRGTPAQSPEATQLAIDLEETRASLFRAQAELRETAQKLDEADLRTAELDRVLDAQTRRLNLVEAERADALNKNAELAKENGHLRRSAWWSKLKAYGVGVGLVGLLGAWLRLQGDRGWGAHRCACLTLRQQQ